MIQVIHQCTLERHKPAETLLKNIFLMQPCTDVANRIINVLYILNFRSHIVYERGIQNIINNKDQLLTLCLIHFI